MHCVVYKSLRKADTYLFVAHEDDFSALPPELCKALGQLEKIMSLQLSAEKKLARGNAVQVLADLHETGFHLQLPPGKQVDGVN